MNILLITETYLPFIAGVSTSSDSIARFMAKRGHHVFLVAPAPTLQKSIEPEKNLTIIRTPSIPDLIYKGKSMTVFPLGIPVIYSLLRTTPIDIIHIQEPASLGISALFLAKIFHIPVVGALHFTPDQVARMLPILPGILIEKITKFYIRIIYNIYDTVMVPTQTFAAFLSSIGVKVPITVVSNGVDTIQFTPVKNKKLTRRNWSFIDDSIIFFFLGRLDEDKNVATLIRALPQTTSNIKLLIAGNGKEEAHLHALTKKLHVENRIIWLETVSQQQMKELYHAVDCFTIMSPYEVQSIVTLQAIASGLPVIAAHAGALPELVQEGKNGFLVNTYDHKTLSVKMNEIAKNIKLRIIMGKESRNISLAHEKSKALSTLEHLYASLL